MHLTSDLARLFAFEDLAEVSQWPAYTFRIGRAGTHRAVTYGELQAAVALRASALLRAGAQRGDRIALLLPYTPALVEWFLGALYAGFVPSIVAWPTAKMDPEKYRRNVTAVVGNLKAQWLVTESATAATLGSILGQTRVIDPSGMPAGAPCEAAPQAVGPAFIQFSGGTTGTQKSVAISLRQLRAQLEAYGDALDLQRQDRVISWLPLYHDMGLVACLLLPFVHRLPATLLAPMEWVIDPTAFLRAVGTDRATLCWLPNFAYSFMAQRVPTDTPLDLSTLRRVTNCSEPVRAESMEAFAARFEKDGLRRDALHSCYAMAETTFAVTQTTERQPPKVLHVSRDAYGAGWVLPQPDGGRPLCSCGPPIAGMQVRVVADGRDAPAGRIGELWLRGACLMDDYLDAAGTERAGRAFTDGWYRSGDLGVLVDGHLYVTGRCKDVIIVGGVNLYPEDLEARVGELQDVHPGRVVAMGLDDERLGTEQLTVVAEVHAEQDLARAKEIERRVREVVAGLCGVAPRYVFVVPPKWIVKSTAGKVSRVETRLRVLQRLDQLLGRTQPGGQ
ncbi:MAG: AMP-binding protein [Myxococcales bacterium]